MALIESGLFREVGIAGIGAVGTWWSGLNREWSLREVGIAGIGAVGTWWSGLNREVVSLGARIGAWWSGLREVVSLGG